jgi:Zinc finger, C2H2 type
MHPVPASKRPLVYCPECKVSFKRKQELRRHILSLHLPCWIYCPYSRCSWRGHRKEDFQKHLNDQKCGPKPERKQYEIYLTDLILDWILEGVPVERAARYALDFVAERALELGKGEEWGNLWGNRGNTTRRRRVD